MDSNRLGINHRTIAYGMEMLTRNQRDRAQPSQVERHATFLNKYLVPTGLKDFEQVLILHEKGFTAVVQSVATGHTEEVFATELTEWP